MPERPPFDPVRASFLLVAAVIGVHCAVVLTGALLCVWHAVALGAVECDSKGRLGDLLAGALAAAIAFGGGMRGRRPRGPPDDKPPSG